MRACATHFPKFFSLLKYPYDSSGLNCSFLIDVSSVFPVPQPLYEGRGFVLFVACSNLSKIVFTISGNSFVPESGCKIRARFLTHQTFPGFFSIKMKQVQSVRYCRGCFTVGFSLYLYLINMNTFGFYNVLDYLCGIMTDL